MPSHIGIRDVSGRGFLHQPMPTRKVLHVVKNHSTNMWKVLPAKASKPVSVHRTQETAIQKAVTRAKKAALGQVKIHRGDNDDIREERTFGKDPEKSPG